MDSDGELLADGVVAGHVCVNHSSFSTGAGLRGFTTIMPIIPALVCMSSFVVLTAAYRGPTADVREPSSTSETTRASGCADPAERRARLRCSP
ncbi:MAG: hypothetical protein QOH72_1926 [Solirubrobacteraceae bacterium]|nr:hypothetical protein [Solirubrobacteraceae bacterium]